MMLGILCLVLAYIAGSFPSGLVIGKTLYHTDPREYGSHNTGATNAYRVFGAAGGLLVLICDVAKGMLGVYLGQVASQTMEAMACTQDVTHLPVLQPLIGMDKRDIVKIAREIGTFDTSILPYEDCCTVFTPRHPKTRPTVAEVAEAESALDVDALVREAVDGIERIRIDL